MHISPTQTPTAFSYIIINYYAPYWQPIDINYDQVYNKSFQAWMETSALNMLEP